MHMADDESTVVALYSEWIGDSQMRVRTRKVGNKRIIIDVFELTTEGHRTSMARARKVARDAARKIRSLDGTEYCLLLDHEIHRKATRFTGEQVLVKIRQTSFAF